MLFALPHLLFHFNHPIRVDVDIRILLLRGIKADGGVRPGLLAVSKEGGDGKSPVDRFLDGQHADPVGQLAIEICKRERRPRSLNNKLWNLLAAPVAHGEGVVHVHCALDGGTGHFASSDQLY